MKKLTILSCLILFLAASCKDESPAEPNDGEEVLNKELLYNKKWYNESKTVSHEFDDDGVYGNLGTWKWLNDSDTMEVYNEFTKKTFYWIFNAGNTETRMEAKLKNASGWGEYRTDW